MSVEKHDQEARRWLTQARADLRAARLSIEGESFEWACFQSQQAAEKALKAFWYSRGLDPWGHSVIKLIDDFGERTGGDPALRGLLDEARLLDKLYVPTRYPNGLPELTPSEVYGRRDADGAVAAALRIIETVTEEVGTDR